MDPLSESYRAVAATVSTAKTVVAGRRLMLWRLMKRKFHYLRTLLSEAELKSVLAASVEELPRDASYKIDDCIHVMFGGSIPVRLKVYGAKAGGYGMVYTVLDAENLKRYCLKVPRGLLTDEREQERARQEAKTWISLGRHPNIAYAHTLLEINGAVAILMEYVSGRDLSARIRQDNLSLREALSYGIQICRGMAHAQRQLPGFVHGDIKPGNCLLTADGTLKITDFGQVRSVAELPENLPAMSGPATEPSYTLPQAWAAGTPSYMAPEYFDAANETDRRSDVYSFGVTLFEMLTGQRPFNGRSHNDCFVQHTRAIPVAPTSIKPDIPERLSELVIRCLAKVPSDRPSDFSIIEQELCDVLRNAGGEEVPESAGAALTEEDLIGHCAALCVLGFNDEAIKCLDQFLLVNSQSAEAWVLKGKALSLSALYDDALECFKRSLDLNPRLSFAWSGAGEVLKEQGLYRDALNHFDRAIAINRRVPAFWNHKGRTLFSLRRTRDAAKCFRRALAVDPLHADSHRALGDLYFEHGDFENAVKCFRRAVGLDAQSVESRCLLADAYSGLGLLEQTIETCREALALKPTSTEVLTRLMTAYRDLYGKHCGTTEPQRAEWLFSLLTDGLNDADFVVEQCLQYLSSCKYDPRMFYLCAFKLHSATATLRHSGRQELRAALAEVRERLRGESPHRPTFYWLGRLYYRLSNYDDCIETFCESIARLGTDDKALYYLAACHELKGNYEQALIHYRQVLTLDPQCHLTPKAIERVQALAAGQSAAPVNEPAGLPIGNKVQGRNYQVA
jgi:serine/threonine protein kinase